MLTTWKQICGNWVLARDGAPLGRVRDMVVNPETGEIPALWVSAAEGIKLLAVSEIQRWTRTEIFVESLLDLISPEEFPRLKKVLNHEVPIINAFVFEKIKKPQNIGKCENFTFDTLSPRLLSIETNKGWWLWSKKRIINCDKIEEITSRGIFVTSPLITERTETKQEAKILQKVLPEPETSQTFRQQ